MRIGITTLGCDSGKSGIGKYAIALLQEVPLLGLEHEFVVATTKSDLPIYQVNSPNLRFDVLPDELNGVMKSLRWHVRQLGKWCKRQDIDVLFLPAGNRRLPWFCPCPTVATVHDLSAFHVEAKYDPARLIYIRKVLPKLIGRVNRVITVSESSRRDIATYTKARHISVIANGYSPDLFKPITKVAGSPTEFGLERGKYWIYVSRLEHPGKNHVKLMEAYEQVLSDGVATPELVFAGGDWDGHESIHARHQSSPAKDRIHLLGFVPDKDLPTLVADAAACVYPSLYEGFGIPLIEAMACDVPVACSNTSSLPEVGGDAALYFEPNDVSSIAQALRQLRDDHVLREDLQKRGLERASGFTWKACAQATLSEILIAGDKR